MLLKEKIIGGGDKKRYTEVISKMVRICSDVMSLNRRLSLIEVQ
ncbi:hypothetical protein [Tepidanaerobacter syntrophicus]|nr:hypothetical protein [Tepidanaerobacter syntrophicus]